MILLFLADGFEEMEAVAAIDILRRAGLAVKTVGVGGGTEIKSARGIPVIADVAEDELDLSQTPEMVILPGGMPGTRNLAASPVVEKALRQAATQNRWIAAICAAPSVLGDLGLLRGKKAVCFPGYEDRLTGARIQSGRVVRDGNIITAKAAGAAVDFALEIVAALVSPEKAGEIRETLF